MIKVIFPIIAYLVVGVVWVIHDFREPVIYRRGYARDRNYKIAFVKAVLWPLFLPTIRPMQKEQRQRRKEMIRAQKNISSTQRNLFGKHGR